MHHSSPDRLSSDRRTFLQTAVLAALAAGLPACSTPAPIALPDPERPDLAPPPEDDGRTRDQALAAGVAFLAGRQADSGAFPSATYAAMRGGHSLTPFVGLALHRVVVDGGPAAEAAAALRDRARAFCAAALARGPLGVDAPILDYPVYATALALRLVTEAPGPDVPLDAVLPWFLAQQHPADHGTAAGGFGMGRRPGDPAPTAEHPGHVDLSMTRRAIEALAALRTAGRGGGAVPAALAAALPFVRRCVASDGGFVYSPVELPLNKSATADGAPAEAPADFRGYGSATADGVLALRAAGVPADDPALDSGLSWLRAHHRPDQNPGLEGAPIEAYAQAMRGYYQSASAAVFALGGGPEGWRAGLRDAVVAAQEDDGAWRNGIALQKEDDPLVATGMALSALALAGGEA